MEDELVEVDSSDAEVDFIFDFFGVISSSLAFLSAFVL